jgi:flagellar biosynthesis/type III secretory pathway protein FliH
MTASEKTGSVHLAAPVAEAMTEPAAVGERDSASAASRGEAAGDRTAAPTQPERPSIEEDRRAVLCLLYEAHDRERCGPTLQAISAAIQHLQAADAAATDAVEAAYQRGKRAGYSEGFLAGRDGAQN